jgi:hypothetical protein
MRCGNKAASEATALPLAPGADAQMHKGSQPSTAPIVNSLVRPVEVDTAQAKRIATIEQAVAERSYDIGSSDVADGVAKHYAQLRADMARLKKLISPTAPAPISSRPKDLSLLSSPGRNVTGQD